MTLGKWIEFFGFALILVVLGLAIAFDDGFGDCEPHPPTPPGCTNDFGSRNPCQKQANDCAEMIGSTANEPVIPGPDLAAGDDPSDINSWPTQPLPVVTEEPAPIVGTVIYDAEGDVIASYPGVTDIAEIEEAQ